MGNGSNRLRQIQITCSMTDLDVLQRLQSILGGNIENKPRLDKRYSNPKPLYRWYITKRREVEPLLHILQPLMGNRRSAKIQEIINYADANQPRYNLVKHGTRNMYRRGCRCSDCKEASNAYARNYRKKNK